MAVSSSRVASVAVGRWTAMVLMLSVMARPLEKARSGVTAQRLRAGEAILPAAKPAHKSALRRLAGPRRSSGLYQSFTKRLRSEDDVSFLAGAHFGEERDDRKILR